MLDGWKTQRWECRSATTHQPCTTTTDDQPSFFPLISLSEPFLIAQGALSVCPGRAGGTGHAPWPHRWHQGHAACPGQGITHRPSLLTPTGTNFFSKNDRTGPYWHQRGDQLPTFSSAKLWVKQGSRVDGKWPKTKAKKKKKKSLPNGMRVLRNRDVYLENIKDRMLLLRVTEKSCEKTFRRSPVDSFAAHVQLGSKNSSSRWCGPSSGWLNDCTVFIFLHSEVEKSHLGPLEEVLGWQRVHQFWRQRVVTPCNRRVVFTRGTLEFTENTQYTLKCARHMKQ